MLLITYTTYTYTTIKIVLKQTTRQNVKLFTMQYYNTTKDNYIIQQYNYLLICYN